MHEKLQQLVDQWIKRYGLQNYELSTYDFIKKLNGNGFIEYHVSAEFFPVGTSIDEDELNPSGTAVIDYNLSTELIESIVFVHQQSYSTRTHFPTQSVREVALWIEQETGFSYEKDFIAVDTVDNGFLFQGFVNGYTFSPTAMIEVQFDAEGKLTTFFMNNMEALRQQIEDEPFHLTTEQVTSFIEQQLTFYEYPDEEKNHLIPIYAIEELFIANENMQALPHRSVSNVIENTNRPLTWENSLTHTIERQAIDGISYVTAEEAFLHAKDAKRLIVPAQTLEQMTIIATDVLRMVHPAESGQWILETIEPDINFLQLTCMKTDDKNPLFKRKFIILVDRESLKVLNYIDNQEILSIFKDFTKEDGPLITYEVALKAIASSVTLTPTYVYNINTGRYELCGMLEADHYVDARTGDCFSLATL